jgi:hypothetical protein
VRERANDLVALSGTCNPRSTQLSPRLNAKLLQACGLAHPMGPLRLSDLIAQGPRDCRYIATARI